MLERYNEEYVDVYADQSTDKNKAFRLALTGDYTGIQTIVNENAEHFRNAVKEARPLKGNKAEVEETLQGAMFSATEAKRRGLIDSIGTFNEAVEVLNYYIKKRKK